MAARTVSPTRPKLDRDVVVDTALAVADTEGLEAVTIRRLAQELAVTPMALYWHFKDKDALLAATADRMWDETRAGLDATSTAPGGAAEQGWAGVRRILEVLVEVMRRHPSVAGLAPLRVVECASGLSVTEQTLRLLAERGFDPKQASMIARYVLCSAVMLVDTQPGGEIVEPGERAEVQRRKKFALASLPPDRYPHTVAAADYLTDCDTPDAYFAEGIDLVVAGVRSQAPAAPVRSRRRS